MKVFKFGGASVKDADGLKRVAEILKSAKGKVIVVVSAMGKTTNALEKLVPELDDPDTEKLIGEIEEYHIGIVKECITRAQKDKAIDILKEKFTELRKLIKEYPANNYDERYDQIVSYGEILSTHIVSSFFLDQSLPHQWFDIRNAICTDNNFRDAKVDFAKTEKCFQSTILPALDNYNIIITQGFVGRTSAGKTTTLGREGSDYTASIIAYCTNAESVTIWKDVPGVLNADPKKFKDTIKIDHLNYQDAIELAYYGASVIHPKTIKPLQNKNIPLFVKPFLNSVESGTCIDGDNTPLSIPCFISKPNQALLSISPKDFSFIAEENLSFIFDSFSKLKMKINMMQHSAINFSVCFDNATGKLPNLLDEFQDNYRVLYNDNVELFTIRYYDQATIDRITSGRNILLEQRSRYTVQLVLK
jgi:aspartate kinase